MILGLILTQVLCTEKIDIKYRIDWGDGTGYEYIDFTTQNVSQSRFHTYTTTGYKTIYVRTQLYDYGSELKYWSEYASLSVYVHGPVGPEY